MEKVTFTIERMSFIEDRNNTQLAVFKLFAFASGDNAHGLPVSVNTLKKTAHTIYNKPVVWKYVWFTDDAGGHEEDEVPCGFVVKENNPIKFTRLKDGRIMMVVNALIWKKYSGRLIEIFQRSDSEKSISVEIEVFETQKRPDGKTELLDFIYSAVTILGDKLTPAIPSAKAQVIQFSKEREDYEKVCNEYFEGKYENINFNIPKNIKANVKKGFELKVANGISSSSKITSIARFIKDNDIISSQKVERFYGYLPNYNFEDIVETNPPTKEYVSSLLCGGKEGIKWMKNLYNEMQIENQKISKYFNNQELEIGKEDMKESMKDMKFNYEETRVKVNELLNEFKNEDGLCKYFTVDLIDETHAVILDIEAQNYLKVEFHDEEAEFSMSLEDAEIMENFAWTPKAKEEDEKAEEGEEEEEKMSEEEMAKKEDEIKKEGDEDKASMSEEEAEEEEEESKKEEEEEEEMAAEECELCKGFHTQIETFQSEIEALKSENETLINYKNQNEAEKKSFEVERVIKEVLEKCPEMPNEEIQALRAESENFSLESLNSWENSVKAKAWNFSTGETQKDGVARIGFNHTDKKGQEKKKSLWS